MKRAHTGTPCAHVSGAANGAATIAPPNPIGESVCEHPAIPNPSARCCTPLWGRAHEPASGPSPRLT
eukprot:1252582-Prymnesium_polylepis.1